MSAIKEAIFTVESVAHMQGHERALLPIADAAWAEHREIIRVLQWLVDSINPNSTGLTHQIEAASAILARTVGDENA